MPICDECQKVLNNEDLTQVPRGALANDMMIFYAMPELYEDGGLTIMEMICASPCITSMICFSMEVKYGNMFESGLHMNRHRVGTRGNATTFLLPWDSVLTELQKLEDQEEVLDLPRTGDQLAHVVHVLLKAHDEDKRADLAQFIHQAHVDRDKVVRVILAAKGRGHRSYARVDEAHIRQKAEKLPKQGVPPELLVLLPTDNTHDKLHMQKAATPVEGLKATLAQAQEALRHQHPNAVVMERSGVEQGDNQLRRKHACLEHFGGTNQC